MTEQASCTFGAPVHEQRWQAVDAVGGVYWRNSPHWNDTDRIPGCGFYQGDYIHLICYDYGDAVGPHGNRLWYRAQDEKNNSIGFINDHYLNTPGTAQNPTLNAPDCWGP
ncbi:hypothetical protein BS329_18095 [Amycolatopsis coloradensis]|uniref:SH3 domain-containing protein n=1 Tax=Amycolatopsis coloradensis TaxID=76021 RepID=A0A1R0KT71_9PSEU|nr:hypothetical protein [Amycolatopsis coloradensis]OLZ51152.1 hypothetical protein BS329_18095 [Amycolatopsis coloradensis]